MKSNKDGKPGPSKKAAPETRTEDDSGAGASHATTPSTVGSSTIPKPATEPVSPSNHSTPPGISMVQSPFIVFDRELSSYAPEHTPSRRPSIAAPDSLETHIDRTINDNFSIESHRRTSYDDMGSMSDQQELEDLDIESIFSATYTLEKDVLRYLRRRESAVLYSYYPGTERSVYDYVSERNKMYTTNLIESTAYLIKGSLGAAVLSMHEAYMIGGLWTSLCVTVFVGILVGYTTIMLIRSAQKMYSRLRITKLSYPDLAEAAIATAPWPCVSKRSKTFRRIVEISLILQMCGTCCIYHIIIANCLRQIIESFNTDIFKWLHDVRMYILISAPLLIPLCLIRSLKYMAPFALLADIFVAICVFTTLYYSFVTFEVAHIAERAAWKSTHGFFRVFGICMYGTSGICFALPVENNMKAPKYFPFVVRYATTIVILLSVMTGFFGYWAWGESCRSPITVHMPSNTFTTILQLFLVMMLSTTFAVNFWVPFRVVWHYIVKKHKRKLAFWELVYRFLMAILVTAGSMIFPKTIPIMIFLGHFFLGFVALVFPAVIELMVDWEEEFTKPNKSKFRRDTKDLCLILLGLTLSGLTIYAVRES